MVEIFKNKKISRECYFCGRFGYIRRIFYEWINNIKKVWNENKFYIELRSYCKVCIVKLDLYFKCKKINFVEEFVCNLVFSEELWYTNVNRIMVNVKVI